MNQTHFEIVTAAGVTVMTYDSGSDARAYCLAMKAKVPGLSVDEVTVTTTRRNVYRPRQSRAA